MAGKTAKDKTPPAGEDGTSQPTPAPAPNADNPQGQAVTDSPVPRIDETVPGGRYFVDGLEVDANGFPR